MDIKNHNTLLNWDDDLKESRATEDLNQKKMTFNAGDIFISALIDLRLNHPEAFNRWSEVRLKEIELGKSNPEEKEKINREADELFQLMTKNREAK